MTEVLECKPLQSQSQRQEIAVRTTSPKIWKACSNFAKKRQPAHEMFVQSDVTGSLEVERAIIILMKNLHFSHCALFEGKPRTTEGIRCENQCVCRTNQRFQ